MKGRVVVIVRALYGLKTYPNAWRKYLCTTFQHNMNFQYSYIDNDFWMKVDVKPNGTKYYTYTYISSESRVCTVLYILYVVQVYVIYIKSKNSYVRYYNGLDLLKKHMW